MRFPFFSAQLIFCKIWIHEDKICKIRQNHNFKSSTQFFMTLSMYSIVAIALHRCYGLITPGASNFDSKRNILLFSLAWLVSFAITIPVFLRSKVHQNRDEKICSVIYASWKFSMQFCNLRLLTYVILTNIENFWRANWVKLSVLNCFKEEIFQSTTVTWRFTTILLVHASAGNLNLRWYLI